MALDRGVLGFVDTELKIKQIQETLIKRRIINDIVWAFLTANCPVL